MDETYVRVKGKRAHLYRAVDSSGAIIDFLLSTQRDADAAKRFFQRGEFLVVPGVIRLILPIMPGWAFLIPGLVILSDSFPGGASWRWRMPACWTHERTMINVARFTAKMAA